MVKPLSGSAKRIRVKAATRKVLDNLLGTPDWEFVPIHVWSRDGKMKGDATRSWYHCRLESCGGYRIRVVWPDGRSTWNCTKGLIVKKGRYRVG